jgi:hypothetical protein
MARSFQQQQNTGRFQAPLQPQRLVGFGSLDKWSDNPGVELSVLVAPADAAALALYRKKVKFHANDTPWQVSRWPRRASAFKQTNIDRSDIHGGL